MTTSSPPTPSLLDGFNRRLNYLRISITDRCNFNCLYCMPGERIPKLRHGDVLRYEEILRLVRITAGLGISKVRVTGGEPLVRKGVYHFLRQLSAIPGIRDLSLTTNGHLLHDNLDKLKSAGIKRLNISLDSLEADTYHRITGHNVFQRVWSGILAAHEAGFSPIKLNAVALRGVNEDELTDLAALSFDYPFHVRFIEHMPFGGSSISTGPPLLTEEIKERISTLGALEPIERAGYDGPARRYRLKGAKGEIGFISPISNHFCAACNRLRLTAGGALRVCLLSEEKVDLKGPLRSGQSDQQLTELILLAASRKPRSHNLTSENPPTVPGQMSSIGG